MIYIAGALTVARAGVDVCDMLVEELKQFLVAELCRAVMPVPFSAKSSVSNSSMV
jgi:hypothetical protein